MRYVRPSAFRKGQHNGESVIYYTSLAHKNSMSRELKMAQRILDAEYEDEIMGWMENTRDKEAPYLRNWHQSEACGLFNVVVQEMKKGRSPIIPKKWHDLQFTTHSLRNGAAATVYEETEDYDEVKLRTAHESAIMLKLYARSNDQRMAHRKARIQPSKKNTMRAPVTDEDVELLRQHYRNSLDEAKEEKEELELPERLAGSAPLPEAYDAPKEDWETDDEQSEVEDEDLDDLDNVDIGVLLNQEDMEELIGPIFPTKWTKKDAEDNAIIKYLAKWKKAHKRSGVFHEEPMSTENAVAQALGGRGAVPLPGREGDASFMVEKPWIRLSVTIELPPDTPLERVLQVANEITAIGRRPREEQGRKLTAAEERMIEWTRRGAQAMSA